MLSVFIFMKIPFYAMGCHKIFWCLFFEKKQEVVNAGNHKKISCSFSRTFPVSPSGKTFEFIITISNNFLRKTYELRVKYVLRRTNYVLVFYLLRWLCGYVAHDQRVQIPLQPFYCMFGLLLSIFLFLKKKTKKQGYFNKNQSFLINLFFSKNCFFLPDRNKQLF